MTAAILGCVLLALLTAWGMTVRHDARTSRRADPIGDTFDAWPKRPTGSAKAPRTPCRRGRALPCQTFNKEIVH